MLSILLNSKYLAMEYEKIIKIFKRVLKYAFVVILCVQVFFYANNMSTIVIKEKKTGDI